MTFSRPFVSWALGMNVVLFHMFMTFMTFMTFIRRPRSLSFQRTSSGARRMALGHVCYVRLKLLRIGCRAQVFFRIFFASIFRSLEEKGEAAAKVRLASRRQGRQGACRGSKFVSQLRIRQKAVLQPEPLMPSVRVDGHSHLQPETSSIKLRGSCRRGSRPCGRRCRCRELPVRRAD